MDVSFGNNIHIAHGSSLPVVLKITPLRLANVPPPMSLHTLPLERKAVDVAFSKSSSRLAILSDSDLAVYALDMHKRPLPKPSLMWRSDAIKDSCPRHITFLGDDFICVLTDSWDEDESCLWSTAGEAIGLRRPVIESVSVSSLNPSVDYNKLHIQFQNGALHELHEVGTQTDLPPTTAPVHKFPSLTPEVQVVAVEGQVCEGYANSSDSANQARH
jgi:elongator complex protein 1